MCFRSISVGYDNHVMAADVVAIIQTNSAPVRRSIQQHREMHRLVDATQGRKARSAVYLRSGLLVLSARTTDAIARRVSGIGLATEDDADEEPEELEDEDEESAP